ncbi:hypothetical protein PCA31118_02425 [Pandoraea captiosa]|uniref:Uncharacterized protein n=1 Tax=Pandoraea captiosa TaxID=2508302 RepID=A0A5E5A2I1_9BURK|nr:hypothetical protein [Pandoraea captiosa]VVE66972.1 hypothetical protein PCA31118_02425 [Pandoraea captiosa]
MLEAHAIGIKSLDTPIYRIFPRKRFLQALEEKALVLVAPRLWDDPLEIDLAIAVRWNSSGGTAQNIIQNFPSAFAQSWSATQESDALLRAYSRIQKDRETKRNVHKDEEGIRVRTTPRKLLQAVIDATSSNNNVSCFIGRVIYMTDDQLMHEIADLIRREGFNALSPPLHRAQRLLLKRTAFSTEAEVRVIVAHNAEEVTAENLLSVKIDPNKLFEEIAFDPRLELFEERERQNDVRDLGYTGKIHDWTLYRSRILEIPMPNDWSPPAHAPAQGLRHLWEPSYREKRVSLSRVTLNHTYDPDTSHIQTKE